MRVGVIIVLLLASSCSRSVDYFEVQAVAGTTATLELCGKTTSLRRDGDKLVTKRATACEGDGEIIVSPPNQRLITCPIGYVTPGLSQNFAFKIEDDECVDVGLEDVDLTPEN